MEEPRSITVIAFYESTDANDEMLKRYLVNAAKSFARNARSAVVGVVVLDEDDNVLGVDVTGSPSEEIQSAIDALVNDPKK
jgi:pyrimidine deaminase RibD-like protein